MEETLLEKIKKQYIRKELGKIHANHQLRKITLMICNKIDEQNKRIKELEAKG